MNEELEKFINAHRHELDQVEQVDAETLWEEFNLKRSPLKGRHLWTVAVFIGLCIVFSVIVSMYSHRTQHVDWMVPDLEEHDPDLAQYQALMIQSIEEQEEIIQSLSIDKNEYTDILQSLNQLDDITKQYKLDLDQNGPSPQIIKALLRCTKQRVRLYELLLYKYELKKYQDELNLQS